MALIPFSPCSPPEPPETNCDWLAEAGSEILGAALDGLADFIPSGSCDDTFDTYLSMGPPVAERYDALSVYLQRFGPTPQAVNERARAGDCPPAIFPSQQALWQVTLWENCIPAARTEGDTIIVPSPERLDAVAQHVYAHGIGMYEAVVSAMVNNTWTMPEQVTLVTVGDMTPLGPQGLAAGWSFPVTTKVGR